MQKYNFFLKVASTGFREPERFMNQEEYCDIDFEFKEPSAIY